MKITGSSGINQPSSIGGAKKSGSDFSISAGSSSEKAVAARASSATSSLFGLDALLALQGEEDVLLSRKRRQVRRATDILDALDEIKLAVLSGDLDDQALIRLKQGIDAQREELEDQN